MQMVTGIDKATIHTSLSLISRGSTEYIDTLARCKTTLEIEQIVPGHGPLGRPAAFDHLIAYLWWLLREVDDAVRVGLSSRATVEAVTLDRPG